ncbi:MAG: IS200/IS605 family element transposase accessory protein TnpB [Pelagibacterales bacterium]|nr:IS200/IS605 family element transposase accessory protein TnpB [Pelagibacterales bacterium]
MQKAFKYRIYPNQEQEKKIAQHLGCVRYIYNKALETKVKHYEQTGKSLSCFELTTGLLKEEKTKYDWLKDPYSQCLQMSLRNLDNAFTRFFKQKKGFPKFKARHDSRQSCQFPQHVKIDFDNNKVYLPKIGHVKTKFSRQFEGKVKTTTLSRASTGKYYVSILVEVNEEPKSKKPVKTESSVGVDLGIKSYIVTSDGQEIKYPKFLRRSIERLKVLQSRASKHPKGGLRRRKAMRKVALLHEKIRNQRHDWLHKLSTKLISENQTVCLEDLNVAGMLKNHCLAQAISDCSWGTFVLFLEYKAEWHGVNILKIGRFEPSSKTCSSCGWMKKDLTLSDREWKCEECHVNHDRDINAALNIKKFALLRQNSGSGRPSELQSANTSTLVE